MKVGIVGLGLIGGSLGLEFVRQGHQVWGVSRRAQTCEQAIAHQMVHSASPDLASLRAVEVVFLCTPIPDIVPTLQTLAKVLSPQAIATDVASVKAPIVSEATQLWPNFVGGHPMAGNAERGWQAAHYDLFRGCAYVLTPIAETAPTAIATVEALVQPLDVRLTTASPEIHDAAVAWISHLPVMVSASLIAACSEAQPEVLQLARTLASSGFRDTSRVGGGNPELGTAMGRMNRAALLRSLYAYRTQLDSLIQTIEEQDWSGLQHLLEQTQYQRRPFVDKED